MNPSLAWAFGSLGAFMALLALLLATPQAWAEPRLRSEAGEPQPTLPWTSTGAGYQGPRGWKTIDPLQQPGVDGIAGQPAASPTTADPTLPDEQPASEPTKPAPQSPWILGIGGGARIGAGEPTYPMVYGRLGRMVHRDASLSLRPRYIFGNSDQQGQSNREGAFQMPLTLDLKPTNWLSPYLGGGIATNTDSTGKTDGMFSMGVDISINRNLAIDIGMNYIFQSSSVDSNKGDFEFTSVLYLRF